MNKVFNLRNGLLCLLVIAVAAYWLGDLGRYLNLSSILEQRDVLSARVNAAPLIAALVFILVYILVTALSLPGAAVMTLVAGLLFGLGWGTLYVSFASSIGATLAFLISRTLLREPVQKRFGGYLGKINAGIEKDGPWYLLGLRLVPVFPFFVINLVMGLSTMKTWKFYLVSQIGMLPATAVYVNAGTQLSKVDDLGGISSLPLILSFTLLGIFPFIAKGILAMLKNNKAYAAWKKPKHFDANLVVIGAGSGGLVSAYIAANVKAKVYLIEKHRMGGDCLNTGCVPSKALIKSAKVAQYIGQSAKYGIALQSAQVNFEKVMARVHAAIKRIEPHDSIERYSKLGVNCIEGEARIIDPWRVSVGERIITTKNIIVATGARPRVPDIPGLSNVPHFTSDTLWQMQKLPKRLLILGGGPIGCELAQAFRRLGSVVTIVTRAQGILPREDRDISELVQRKFESEGIEIVASATADKIGLKNSEPALLALQGEQHRTLRFDALLIATGRQANTEGFGLAQLGIEKREDGTLKVDEYMRTSMPNILACGDVTGPFQFTHAASHQAWYASVNAMFGKFKKFKVDYRYIPWCTFTDPEVARVGYSEAEADEAGIEYEVTHYDLAELDRAIADGSNYGCVKVLTVPGKDKILGACIVGPHAGDLLAEFVLAMKHGLGLNKILATPHLYPSLAEANKYAAGEWRKAHVPEKIMAYMPGFHRWMRGQKK
jgi:pyruvate/2-oxoglutarate dehydrogenase complex dihydrolipoamide dehydrogenase (E3) component/uncharacterized membrane protein YdjX (TVP38/TMEM64 family)